MNALTLHLRRAAAIASIALLLLATSCAFSANQRTWIPDQKYEVAKGLFQQTGSLSLTEQTLRESHTWRKAEINEAVYRLKKEFDLK